mmetsp:Transcript_30182/g.54788  ORF Transcript_30182/g.54788 Transcript_30182/m.54788 type:complete len:350 (+) Transcript_30182:114-1163(+)
MIDSRTSTCRRRKPSDTTVEVLGAIIGGCIAEFLPGKSCQHAEVIFGDGLGIEALKPKCWVSLGFQQFAVLGKLHLDSPQRFSIARILPLDGWFPQESNATSVIDLEPWKTKFGLSLLKFQDALCEGSLVGFLFGKGIGSGFVATLLMLVRSEFCFEASPLVGHLFLAHPKVPRILGTSTGLLRSLRKAPGRCISTELNVDAAKLLACASRLCVAEVLYSLVITLGHLPGEIRELLHELGMDQLLSVAALLQTFVLLLCFFAALLCCRCFCGWLFCKVLVLDYLGEALLSLGISVNKLQTFQLMLELAERRVAKPLSGELCSKPVWMACAQLFPKPREFVSHGCSELAL